MNDYGEPASPLTPEPYEPATPPFEPYTPAPAEECTIFPYPYIVGALEWSLSDVFIEDYYNGIDLTFHAPQRARQGQRDFNGCAANNRVWRASLTGGKGFIMSQGMFNHCAELSGTSPHIDLEEPRTVSFPMKPNDPPVELVCIGSASTMLFLRHAGRDQMIPFIVKVLIVEGDYLFPDGRDEVTMWMGNNPDLYAPETQNGTEALFTTSSMHGEIYYHAGTMAGNRCTISSLVTELDGLPTRRRG
jgi:hypothetical protein